MCVSCRQSKLQLYILTCHFIPCCVVGAIDVMFDKGCGRPGSYHLFMLRVYVPYTHIKTRWHTNHYATHVQSNLYTRCSSGKGIKIDLVVNVVVWWHFRLFSMSCIGRLLLFHLSCIICVQKYCVHWTSYFCVSITNNMAHEIGRRVC